MGLVRVSQREQERRMRGYETSWAGGWEREELRPGRNVKLKRKLVWGGRNVPSGQIPICFSSQLTQHGAWHSETLSKYLMVWQKPQERVLGGRNRIWGFCCQAALGFNRINSTSLPAVCSREPGAGGCVPRCNPAVLGEGSTETAPQHWQAEEQALPGLRGLGVGAGVPGRKATFNSSLDLGTQKTWGRRGNAAMGGACHPVPSLAPLTELNALSILSVLESSWERAGGQGEKEGGRGGREETRARI